MGPIRKLENILRELKPLEDQAKVERFFNNLKNADKLGGLVEGIRDAVMGYQVCNQNISITLMSDIRLRRRYSKVSTTRVVNSL
jgi:hypothetical protein